MYNRRLLSAISLILVISLVVTTTPTTSRPQPNTAKFVLAGWDYPDEYGQGLSSLLMYDNDEQIGFCVYNNASNTFTIDPENNITLKIASYINQTTVGASTVEAGKNYLRHSITITTPSETVFAQQNFTYVSGSLVPATQRINYLHKIWLNVSWVSGMIYTAAITCEIYYPPTDSEIVTPEITADSDDTNWEDSTNENGRTENYVAGFVTLREYWFRISIPLPKGTPILLATMYFYATVVDTADEEITLQRSTEIDLGSMEADTTKPATTVNNESVNAWPVGTGWFGVNCTDLIQAIVNNAAWANNSYAGFRLYDSGDSDDGNALEDYSHADAHHTYLNITTGDPWHMPSEFDIIFSVSYSTEQVFLGNFFFIVLGLVMVPASTIYLVYGGRKNMSANKFFYFLIAFIIGWAFIIGGVMP